MIKYDYNMKIFFIYFILYIQYKQTVRTNKSCVLLLPTSPEDVAEATANPATTPPTTTAFGSTPDQPNNNKLSMAVHVTISFLASFSLI